MADDRLYWQTCDALGLRQLSFITFDCALANRSPSRVFYAGGEKTRNELAASGQSPLQEFVRHLAPGSLVEHSRKLPSMEIVNYAQVSLSAARPTRIA